MRLRGRLVRLAFLDGDDSVAADLLHRIGDELADLLVVVGRDGADVDDLVLVGDWLGQTFEGLEGGIDRLLNPLADDGRIRTEADGAEPLLVDRAAEDRGGGRAVASHVAGLGGDLVDELGPHMFVGVFELDLFGDGYAVLGDDGVAEALVDDHVAACGAHGDRDSVGQGADPALQLEAGPIVEE